MGYPRLPVEKQCELAPTLLTAMEGKPQPQQDRYDTLTADPFFLSLCESLFSFNRPDKRCGIAHLELCHK